MVARVRIRHPYTDLVNEMHLENWASIQDQEAEFQSVPLERRWVESGRELSTVLQRFTLAEAWRFLLGTGNVALTTHLPITHRLNVRELTFGASDAIFKGYLVR